MRVSVAIFCFMIVFISCKQSAINSKKYNYPNIKKNPVTEEYCGVKITDDYRNLENLKDSTVVHWFKNQELYTDSILNQIKGSEALFEKMKDYASKSKFETGGIRPLKNGNYFYLKLFVEDNAPTLFMKKSLDAKEEFLFDPKTYKKESGKSYAVRSYSPSWDGKKLP
jgi:prolyl oligopeptidase